MPRTTRPGRRPGVVAWPRWTGPAGKAVHHLLARRSPGRRTPGWRPSPDFEDVLDESEGGRQGRHAGDYWSAVFGEPGDDPLGLALRGAPRVDQRHGGRRSGLRHDPVLLGANPAILTDDERPHRLPAPGLGGGRRRHPPGFRSTTTSASRAVDQPAYAPRSPAPTDPSWSARAYRLRRCAPDQLSLAPQPRRRSMSTACRARLRRAAAWRQARRGPAQLLLRLGRPVPTSAPGQPHYYRLDGPRFLVEFDNRQNRANHVHSVWRDPGCDFGARLLVAEPDRAYASDA